MSSRSVLLFPGALLVSLPLVAQSDPKTQDVVRLDALVVTNADSLRTTLPVRPVEGLYGFETPYQDVPRSLTQINPRQFEQDIISSYSDFTRYSPAVNQATGQLANYGSPTIRGSITDVYQNGVRMLVRQSNNRPFTLNAYEAADIVAGPAPIIYGPSARTSGYVNYLTKKPYFDAPHTTITYRVGKVYLDDSGYEGNHNLTIDTGAPLIKNKLAYRVSYQGESLNSLYENVHNRFHDLYGTLSWIPTDRLTLDWNFEYGTFDWKVNNGLNRVTNDLIRSGTYLAGPATPIIQVGTGLFSPVLAADGSVTSWITRTRSGTKFLPGSPTSNPTSNSASGAGTIVGYVFDPNVVVPASLEGSAALNAPGWPSTTDAFNTQLRVKRIFTERFTALNNTIYQYYKTDTASNGGFYNWITSRTLENRTEGLLSLTGTLFGRPLVHSSNTGVSYRFESVKNYKDGQASSYGPTGDWFDLKANPEGFTRNAFFGANVFPFAGTTATPVLTRFGYLKGFWTYLQVPESPDNYVTAGGSQTGTPGGNLSTATNWTRTHSVSAYSQHSLRLGEKWLLDVGWRGTVVYSSIRNPLPLNASFANIRDGIRAWTPGSSASLSYKPVSRLTVYGTYSYVVATNGMTTGSPTWATVNGAPNQYDPNNFHSQSELREIGLKTELIPGKLTVAASAYRQTRDLTLTIVPGQDPVLAKGLYQGVEYSVRYQPTRDLIVGLNYNYLSAITRNQVVSAANALVADNATNVIGSTSLGLGNWRIQNLPRNNVTLFASYQFASGFGLKADAWVRDAYIANASGTLVVPSQFNLNVGAFYNQPAWSADVTLQNATGERNFAGASAVLEPANLQARFTYKF